MKILSVFTQLFQIRADGITEEFATPENCGTVEFEINDNLFHIPVYDVNPGPRALEFESGGEKFWLGNPVRIPYADE